MNQGDIEVLDLLKQGRSQTEIAAQFGCSRQRIHQRIARLKASGEVGRYEAALLRQSKPSLPIRIEGDVAYIALVCGHEAMIDATDVPLVAHIRWTSRQNEWTRYVFPSGDDPNVPHLHRFLLGEGPEEIDHANRNGLDNRRANLRPCSHGENMRNRKKPVNGISSRFKGVTRPGRYWLAQITTNGVVQYLGRHKTEEAAARAYDAAAIRLHGQFARTNEMLGLYDQEPSVADLRRMAHVVPRARKTA